MRNDYLSSDGIKTHDDVLNELVKFLITIQSLYNLNHKMVAWNAYFEGPIELEKYSKTLVIQYQRCFSRSIQYAEGTKTQLFRIKYQ